MITPPNGISCWQINPDIPTRSSSGSNVKTVQSEKPKERIKAERIAAWRKGLLELTDIEIYELGLKILADKLHVYGYVGVLATAL